MSVLFSKSRPGQCRWIVCDDVGNTRDLFGGRRVCGAETSYPTSYCAAHRLRVYARAPGPSEPGAPVARPVREREPDHQPDLTEMFA